ncbi:phosphotransferase family protein [Kitasatospora cinereorecta]|uniref:Phosphotransferase family protein n=1 Tax=Kitasatospora cinereorecta TaxID=285560 RepID=A0ABW0VC28_9ACTN
MIKTEPSRAALEWAAEAAGVPGSGWAVSRLLGGAHAATHLLRAERGGAELVLRRFPAGDGAAAYEARVLRALDGLGGWAPRLVAADPDGARVGGPAVLISRLPGRADLSTAPAHTAAQALGRALARVHAVPTERLAGVLRDGMAAGSRPLTADAGPGAPVLAAHGDRLARQQPVLTHFDFWSGNVLWQDGELTGVVDWSGASLAPRGFDVSWCRLDLALLHGPAAAEAFLTAYREAAGTVVADLALWDVFALTNAYHRVESWLPNYHELGRADLTAVELRRRHTSWTAATLERTR